MIRWDDIGDDIEGDEAGWMGWGSGVDVKPPQKAAMMSTKAAMAWRVRRSRMSSGAVPSSIY